MCYCRATLIAVFRTIRSWFDALTNFLSLQSVTQHSRGGKLKLEFLSVMRRNCGCRLLEFALPEEVLSSFIGQAQNGGPGL
jgi:hypothetical protein